MIGLQTYGGQRVELAGLNENGPIDSCICIHHSWWSYLGRIRRCGFVRGGVSLGVDFGVSKTLVGSGGAYL